MHIIHVIDSLKIGGAEKLVFDLAVMQRQMGNDVAVAVLAGTGSELEKELRGRGIPVHAVNGTGGSVYSPAAVFRIGRFLREADVVHVHLFPASHWCALHKFLFHRGLRMIFTEHSTTNKRREKKIFKPVERFVYKQFNAVIGCSEVACEKLNEFLETQTVRHIPNGVNIRQYAEAQPYDRTALPGVGEDTVILSMVARFRKPKDQPTVIRGLTLLPRNVHAVFIGDGELRADCENLAARLGVASRCHFLGVRNDVASLVRMSDINVLSSRWEGLSLSSIECMAARKPFVGSDVQGIKEIVAGAGLLFEYGNEQDFARTVENLLQSADLYEAVAESCYQKAGSYDIRRTNDAYMEVYNEILRKNGQD